MRTFFHALKAGVKGFVEGPDPEEYTVAGRPVKCPHCGEATFMSGSALLNTRTRSAFNVDWADPLAYTLVCAECGRIEWFAKEPAYTKDPGLEG
jgi:rRNA maturation protein Nop10